MLSQAIYIQQTWYATSVAQPPCRPLTDSPSPSWQQIRQHNKVSRHSDRQAGRQSNNQNTDWPSVPADARHSPPHCAPAAAPHSSQLLTQLKTLPQTSIPLLRTNNTTSSQASFVQLKLPPCQRRANANRATAAMSSIYFTRGHMTWAICIFNITQDWLLARFMDIIFVYVCVSLR